MKYLLPLITIYCNTVWAKKPEIKYYQVPGNTEANSSSDVDVNYRTDELASFSTVDSDFSQESEGEIGLNYYDDDDNDGSCDGVDGESGDDGVDSQKESGSDVEKMKECLREWAVSNNITIYALSSLCKILKINHSCFGKLPSEGRSILKTPVNLSVKSMPPGDYIHVGLKKQLGIVCSTLKFSNIEFVELSLLFNIDGLPLFDTPGELYPILFSVPSVVQLRNKVCPVGLYYGQQKPNDLELYLSDVIDELNDVTENGFLFDEKVITVKVLGFCCDVPAKSNILGTTAHTGYSSFTRCTVYGVHTQGKRVFLENYCPKRGHQDFINRTDLRY